MEQKRILLHTTDKIIGCVLIYGAHGVTWLTDIAVITTLRCIMISFTCQMLNMIATCIQMAFKTMHDTALNSIHNKQCSSNSRKAGYRNPNISQAGCQQSISLPALKSGVTKHQIPNQHEFS